jgi:hypothetical protein
MASIVPIVREADGPSFFDLQAVLDGVTYTLEFRWNVRMGAWFMNVLDAEGVNPTMLGVRLVVDYALGWQRPDRAPPGVFIAIDTGAAEGEGQDPGFDDLGNRVQLWYVPEAEI